MHSVRLFFFQHLLVIFVSVREHKPLTLRTPPLIFVSTVATHLFGGSSGREGAALLLGGSVSGQLGRALRLENRDCRLMTMCGMAGAFSAIFGTPLKWVAYQARPCWP